MNTFNLIYFLSWIHFLLLHLSIFFTKHKVIQFHRFAISEFDVANCKYDIRHSSFHTEQKSPKDNCLIV